MTSPAEFWPEALPYAEQAKAAVPSLFMSVILAQWGIETGYGGYDWSVAHNPGNVGSYDGQPVNHFPTLEAGTQAYIQTIQLDYYVGVRAAKTWESQCYALGESPWASGHYALPLGVPGSSLVSVIQTYNLTSYDGPTPNYREDENMTSIVVGGQLHVFGVVGTTAYHWWQDLGPPASTWHMEKLPE